MQLHSNNIDNDRIILLQQLCARLSNKEHIIQRPTWLSGAQEKKTQCLTLLKDYHFIEMKVGL